MSDHKTEQPTARRREKAREQGQVARSRELSSAFAVLACMFVLQWRSSSDLISWRQSFQALLDRAAASASVNVCSLLFSTGNTALQWAAWPMLAGLLFATAVSFAQGGLTWSPAAMQLKIERLNPAERAKQLFSLTALSSLLRSLLPVAAMLYLGFGVLIREWALICQSMFQPSRALVSLLGRIALEIGWKCCVVMLLWSLVDYLFVRYRVESGMRMSREEVRQEHKETEGNPQVKARIRRLQRQTRRHRMLQDVAKAAVVVTNPTHYAIALAYSAEMAAPVVVAKGRDRLAMEIKEAARWNEVPMVENPPVAHALYRATSVGQPIPSKLYVAVAEILAFVYRTQTRRTVESWS